MVRVPQDCKTINEAVDVARKSYQNWRQDTTQQRILTILLDKGENKLDNKSVFLILFLTFLSYSTLLNETLKHIKQITDATIDKGKHAVNTSRCTCIQRTSKKLSEYQYENYVRIDFPITIRGVGGVDGVGKNYCHLSGGFEIINSIVTNTGE